MNGRRYPIAPLVAALNLPAGASITRALNISGTAYTTYTANGLGERSAERLAVRVGLAPYEVWPEMLEHAIADLERRCAADGCTETFIQLHGGPRRRFCSRRCKSREHMRSKGPEHHRDAKRRYRAEVAELEAKRAGRRAA